jgi:hypothetical protein
MAEELKPLSSLLDELEVAEKECLDANVDVEENDYTIFSRKDLEFELELVQQAVAKKSLFIENQVNVVSFPELSVIAEIFNHRSSRGI